MTALIAAYATLAAVLPFLALWHGARVGGRTRPPWRASGTIPAHATVASHRDPWDTTRLAAGGW
jgi:hypothetical protein